MNQFEAFKAAQAEPCMSLDEAQAAADAIVARNALNKRLAEWNEAKASIIKAQSASPVVQAYFSTLHGRLDK